jgi:limonene-1,2-epoxide hydrolase
MSHRITRRNLIVAGGLGAIASALHSPAAEAKAAPASADAGPKMTDTEKANVKLVRDFLAGWDDANLDIDKLVGEYMAPNVAVRWTDDMPAAIGPEAAAKAAKAGMPPGSSAVIKIYRVFVRGPVVTTSRLDRIKVPGKPDQLFPTAGVHIVKNGKIVEYTDYVVQ